MIAKVKQRYRDNRENKVLLKGYKKEWENKRINWTPYILIVPLLALLIFYLVIPLLNTIWMAFSTATGAAAFDRTALTLDNFRKFFQSSTYVPIMWRTIKVSLVMTATCVLLGYPVAYYMSKMEPHKQRLYMLIYLAPWMLNIVVKAYGWMILLDNSGLLNKALMALGIIDGPLHMLFTSFAVTVGLIHGTIVLAILPIFTSLSAIDPNVGLAAANLGASPFQVFMRVTLPQSRLGIITGALICFASSMAAYTTPLLLGGTRFRLFSYSIYEQSNKLLNWPQGSAFSLILMLIALVGVVLIQKSMSSDKDKRGRELL